VLDGEIKLVQSVYPNPFTRSVTIQLNKDEEEIYISIIDLTGRIVLQNRADKIESRMVVLTQEYLPSGAYILIVRSNEVEEKILLIKE